MNQNNIYSKVYDKMLDIEDIFNLRKVATIAFLSCPPSCTKEQIVSMASNAIKDGVANGQVLAICGGLYETARSYTKNSNIAKGETSIASKMLNSSENLKKTAVWQSF